MVSFYDDLIPYKEVVKVDFAEEQKMVFGKLPASFSLRTYQYV